MPKTLVKRGEEYLSCIQLSELEETYRREYPGKSRDRLQAAVLRKRGRVLRDSPHLGGVYHVYTVS